MGMDEARNEIPENTRYGLKIFQTIATFNIHLNYSKLYVWSAYINEKKIIQILREYLNGFVAARGKFLSIFICICKGEYDALLGWPFCHRISFTLVDQCQDPAARRNVTYSIKPNIIRDNKAFLGRPIGERNASFGAQKFVELEVLKEKDYIRDDCVFIKCTIDSDDMILL